MSMRGFYELYIYACCLVVFLLILTIFWMNLNESKFMLQYRKKIRSPSEYSLEIKGIPNNFTEGKVYFELFE